MDIGKIFTNPDLFAIFVGVLISFPIGVLFTFLIQLIIDRRQKLQITFSKTTEAPLILSNEDIKKKLKIYYENTQIEKLIFFKLTIANTGKKTITNQTFTCQFAEGTSFVESPRITTKPSSEVGPIVPETQDVKNGKYRFNIEVLGVNQIVYLEFLTSNSKVSDSRAGEFEVIPRPNSDVRFAQGNISGIPTLERDLKTVLFNLLLFYVTLQTSSVLGGLVGDLGGFISTIGVLYSITFLIAAWRASRSVIPVIARKLQVQEDIEVTQMANISEDHRVSIENSWKKHDVF